MPRLSRAQREAKEARKATVAAQLAADAQTSIGGGKSASRPAPPPPLASALSNNQPIKITTSGTRGIPAEEDDAEGRVAEKGQASPSLSTADRGAIQLGAGAGSSSIRGRKEASSSAVPGSPAPGMESDLSTSDNSDDELNDSETAARGSASAPADETVADGEEEDELGGGDGALSDSSPEVKCMWEDCGMVFTSLIPFINHLHDEHVGIHKARYSCEWSGCPRKGKFQTSRFALLSHLRSHTGEKPFTCPRPECDKSFTRSDALAKHMRVQHNINPVSTRGKSANHLGMASGRASRMRGIGDDDSDFGLGLGGAAGGGIGEDGVGRGSADVLADELLELAEGETNGSLADVETSLLLHGAKSPFYTYDNLFGAGSRALAHLGIKRAGTGNAASVAATLAAQSAALVTPDAELGIVRDTQQCTGLLLNDDMRDDEVQHRDEQEMARVLEAGRREWVRHEREQAESRPDPESLSSKRDVVDYLSDEDMGDVSRGSQPQKRARRSSTRNAHRQAQGISDVANVKRLYIVEKAKLRFIREENERMRTYLAELRTLERSEMLEKRALLERTLESELGKDVGAIFSPPGSPERT